MLDKPIIALMDPESSRGGLTVEEVRAQLLEAEGRFKSWGFEAGTTPRGAALYEHLFANDPIEWNRAR